MTSLIKKPFVPNGDADEHDVRVVKKTLNRIGYYTPYDKVGITPIPDAAVFAALREFQRTHELPVTGEMRPGDATATRIAAEAAKTPDGYYIWRTVEDDVMVHTARAPRISHRN